MADFSAIKTEIQTNIDTNGNQEITGAVLQDTLIDMVDATEGNITGLDSEIFGTKSLIFGEIEGFYKEGFYLNKYGEYTEIEGGACIVSRIIRCTEGDVFSYYGQSEYNAVGWIFRQDGNIISTHTIGASSAGNATIIVPSGVDSIQFASYSLTKSVEFEVTKTYPVPLEDKTSQLVFTKLADVNKIIKTLYIDTSKYSGSVSLDGLYLANFQVANYNGGKYYWDFAIRNKNHEIVVTNIWRNSESDENPNRRYEVSNNGVFLYVEYIWENATKGFYVGNVPLTPYAFDAINDPRYSKSVYTDADIQRIKNDAFVANYEVGGAEVNVVKGYLNKYGNVSLDDSLRGKYTSKIPCHEGDVYLYKGKGEYSVASVLYYKDDELINCLQYVSTSEYTEVVVPNGVNYVVFSSYTTTTNPDVVVLEFKRTSPLSYAALLEKVNNLQNASNPLYGKKVGWDGDSVSAGAGYFGGYGNIIAERNNMINQNLSVSGGTIASNTYSNGYARHWICDSVNNFDLDCDYIIVEGGINDMWNGVTMGAISDGFDAELDSKTFCGALETMIKNLYLRFPGKKMGYVLIHQAATGKWSIYENSNYVSNIIKVCKKWGFPLLDLNTTIPPFAKFEVDTELRNKLSAIYTSNNDGCHPTQEGYLKYYCDKIEAWMKTL